MGLKKSISLNFISQVVNLIAGIGSSILLARILGPEGRGDYILVITSAGFLVQFFSFGIESSVSHYVASRKIELPRLLYSVFVFVLSLIGVIILGTILISTFTEGFLIPNGEIHYYIILILLVTFIFLNSIFSAILSGTKNFRSVIWLSTCLQILMLITAGIFFLFFKHQESASIPILYSTIAVYGLISIGYFVSYCKLVGVRPKASFMTKKEFNTFFSYSLISFVCSVLQFLSYKMDFWIVNYYWGSTNLGIYSLGASLSQLLWLLPQSIAMILFPMTSYYERGELAEITERLLRISLFATLFIVFPLLLIAPYFIPLLFGTEFSESVFYFQLFLFGIFPFIMIKIFASIFAGMGKVKYNLVATITGFLGGAIAYIFLIPRMGLIGGVIGSIISYLLTTSVGIYFYQKEFHSSFKDLVLLKKTDWYYLMGQLQNFKIKKSQ